MEDSIPSEDEIQISVKKFVSKHRNDTSEEQQKQSFLKDFFMIFNKDVYDLGRFERPVYDSDGNYVGAADYFIPGLFLEEHKSAHYTVDEAMDQARDRYYPNFKHENIPKYILGCNFREFFILDLTDQTQYRFGIDNLPKNIGLFRFIIGKPKTDKTIPVNQEAAELVGRIFNNIKDKFTGTQAGYFMTRLVFCFFADYTGIFMQKRMFLDYIKKYANEDGSNFALILKSLFSVFDQRKDTEDRKSSSALNAFPYINGSLFSDKIEFPEFDKDVMDSIIEAASYDWSSVSPVIFGSMFESALSGDRRRAHGAHYTEEDNILKVIRPLFLDGLKKEYREIVDGGGGGTTPFDRERLLKFHKKLASLKFFDPACGSGNFLIITYRELRRLEHQVITKLYDESKILDPDKLSLVDVDQFHGIELMPFTSNIAQVSLWMMDHMMNMELSTIYGRVRRIPIKKKPNIVCEDALEIDWSTVCPPEECDYVLGNPPFGGSKTITKEKREQIRRVSDMKGGTLDYVTGWFIKASEYINDNAKIGFVATNSITQGEQVGQLWPILFSNGMNIIFGYGSFKWESEASKSAAVTVVIVGLAKNNQTKRLFYDNEEKNPQFITPYMIGGKNQDVIVFETSKPINKLPEMRMGTKPIDAGHYIFKTEEEKEHFIKTEPSAEPYIKPYIGADDYINGKIRYILHVEHIPPNILSKLPKVKKRIKSVKEYRTKSTSESTRNLDAKLFHLRVIPDKPFLIIPRVSSEKREYIPIGYLEPPIIPNDATMVIENASMELFGLLTSKMHMQWLKLVGGKLETRLRYSKGIVYNTFPLPSDNLVKLAKYAQDVLDIRKKYPDSTLADLYDPAGMPPDLKKAHDRLDRAVDKLYRKSKFESDIERIEFLLGEYQKMTNKQTRLP